MQIQVAITGKQIKFFQSSSKLTNNKQCPSINAAIQIYISLNYVGPITIILKKMIDRKIIKSALQF
jgi:hypothetical protein